MSWRKRIARDIQELRTEGFVVRSDTGNDDDFDMKCFQSLVKGPKDSPYENCSWHVRFTIPDAFPFTSPSVGFIERILHPNVDEQSGSICLDALNKAWSPGFSLKHIVEVLLPYLLMYPNPDDPLNREAAHLMKTNPEAFKDRVIAHSLKHSFKAS